MPKSKPVSTDSNAAAPVPAPTGPGTRKRAKTTASAPRATKPGRIEASKSAQVLKLLQRKNGASLADLQALTGWQAHSVRGFLSGTVKKRLGLVVQSEQAGSGKRRYRIAAA